MEQIQCLIIVSLDVIATDSAQVGGLLSWLQYT